MITIRVTMRSHRTEPGEITSDGIQTIGGSVPMRRIPVNISKHTEDDVGNEGDRKAMGIAV